METINRTKNSLPTFYIILSDFLVNFKPVNLFSNSRYNILWTDICTSLSAIMDFNSQNEVSVQKLSLRGSFKATFYLRITWKLFRPNIFRELFLLGYHAVSYQLWKISE